MITLFCDDNDKNNKKHYLILSYDDSNEFAVFIKVNEHSLWNKLCDEEANEIALLSEVDDFHNTYKSSSNNYIEKNFLYLEGMSPFLVYINQELDNFLSTQPNNLPNQLVALKNCKSSIVYMYKEMEKNTKKFLSLAATMPNYNQSILSNIPKENLDLLNSIQKNWEKVFGENLDIADDNQDNERDN